MRLTISIRSAVLAATILPQNYAIAAYVVPPTAPVKDVRTLDMSYGHACAILASGALRCLGNNEGGQIGNGKLGGMVEYAEQVFANGVTSVATGDVHTCAIVRGALYCWGDNVIGQIGTGKAGGVVSKPTRIIDHGVTAVAVGGQSTCAVAKGALYCWGANDQGQIGNGKNGYEPVLDLTMIFPNGVTAVAMGRQHSCAVVNGALYCWGFMIDPQSGALKIIIQPIKLIEHGVTAVTAAMHTCAIVDTSLQCWGRNLNGQVGVPEGPRVAPRVPVKIIERGVTDVATNNDNTCAIVNAALYCWGSTNLWRLGALIEPILTPKVLFQNGVTAVGVGMNRVCAVVDGILQCTHRIPDPDQPKQDWNAFGTNNTPFVTPEPENPKMRYGLWRGTIGKEDVMVMLQPKTGDSSYYYLQQLWGITLNGKDKRGTIWEEESVDLPMWKLELVGTDAARGMWLDDVRKRSVPIELKLVTAIDSKLQGATLNAQFNQPRFDALNTVAMDAKFKNRKYRRVTALAGAIEGLEIHEDRNRLIEFNKAMNESLRANVEQYYYCQLQSRRHASDDGRAPDYFKQTIPIIWSDKLLVLKTVLSITCGGPHPEGGIEGYLNWDVITDQPIDPWLWIRDSKDEYGIQRAPEKLQQLIRASAGTLDEECSEAIAYHASYLIYPGEDGMVFSPSLPRVVQACANDIVVPYDKLRPYLTPEGVAKVDALFVR